MASRLTCLCAAVAAAVTAAARAQDAPRFAEPVRLMAGDRFLGENRLYPSPVWHDVDGDGLLDIVVGDLPGRLTYAPRLPGETLRFGPEKKLQGQDGRPLDFSNW